MKNLMLLGLFATLINTSVMAGEGNGGGVNGPDLKGTAIPVKMDRDILVTRVKQVAKECSTEFAYEIFELIYGRAPKTTEGYVFTVKQNVEDKKVLSYISGLSFAEHVPDKRPASDFHFIDAWVSISGNGVDIFRDVSRTPVERFELLDLLNYYNAFKSSQLHATANIIPLLQFKPTAVDHTYDEFGEIVSERLVAKNIAIQVSSQEPLTLTNTKTGKQVGLKIDTRPYVDCLLTNLQK